MTSCNQKSKEDIGVEFKELVAKHKEMLRSAALNGGACSFDSVFDV
jgi:hypothetical protein